MKKEIQGIKIQTRKLTKAKAFVGEKTAAERGEHDEEDDEGDKNSIVFCNSNSLE
jgi:hypothetical protein